MIRVLLRHWREAWVECVVDAFALAAWGGAVWLMLWLAPGWDAAVLAWRAQ